MSDDPAAPGVAGPPLKVLCVCEGNICRSPVAQLLLQQVLGSDVVVASAGTRAVVGASAAPPMLALLGARGVSGDAFRARQLEPAMLRDADLVLTMTGRQRRQAVTLAPAVVRRTFVLRELARLLDDAEVVSLTQETVGDRLRAALPRAAARRRFVLDPQADDVDDPYGQSDAAYRRAFDAIDDAVRRIATRVGQSSGTAASRPDPVGQNDAGGTTDRAAASASS